jgi:hypothetical protein
MDADLSHIGAHRRRADFIDYSAAERLSGGSSASGGAALAISSPSFCGAFFKLN